MLKRVDGLCADFVVGRADTRTDGCDQVGGIGPMLTTHGRHRRRDHAGDNASPSGVRGGYDLTAASGDQHRNTVGRSNGQHDTTVSCDHGIRRSVFVRFGRIDVHDSPAVDLINRSEHAAVTADGCQEQLVVGADSLWVIGWFNRSHGGWLSEVQCV